MALQWTITNDVRNWFSPRRKMVQEFSDLLDIVCADELTLMRMTIPVSDPVSPFMLRGVRFSGGLVLMEWHHARRLVRVVAVRPPNIDDAERKG